MRYVSHLILALGIGNVPIEADVPKVDPVLPVVELPIAPAIPSPMPQSPTVLVDGEMYVVKCRQKCRVATYPAGVVSVAAKSGPRDVTGRFAGGGGKDEDKTFDAPILLILKGVQSGKVLVEITPFGFTDESQVVKVNLDVQMGLSPQPPPTPKPDPVPPKPVEPPSPLADAGLHVLIVYDDSKGLTAEQGAIITGKAVRDWLEANCVPGPDGKTKQYRIFKAGVDASGDLPVWASAMKRPRTAGNWMLISNGKTGWEGELPKSPAEFLALANKFKG